MALLRSELAGPVEPATFLPEMLERTATASLLAGLSNVEVLSGEWRRSPRADASVDLVISNGVLNLSARGDLIEAAANLFSHLRALDAAGAATIAVMPVPHAGLGEAINDRLARAAAPRA